MAFELRFTPEAEKNYNDLQVDGSKKSILKAVRKTLGFLEKDPSYPSLQLRLIHSLQAVSHPSQNAP
jgi:mRNA-degrading endonuclease RelE of RelBE toxin-antitoxin system